MNGLPKEIRRRIRDVQAGRTTCLNINGWELDQPLEAIPDEVFALAELEELMLPNNSLRVVPERIRELSNLKVLGLFKNPIHEIADIPGLQLDWDSYLRCRQSLTPAHIVGINIETGVDQDHPTPVSHPNGLLSEIFGLPCLRVLWIGLKSIVHRDPMSSPDPEPIVGQIIERIGQLSRLEDLNLFGLSLRSIPDGIVQLRELRSLTIAGAGLSLSEHRLPDLPRLSRLNLILNELASLPDSLESLQEVRELFLGDNNFAEFPKVLFKMKMLEELQLSKSFSTPGASRIFEIPSDILRLANLRRLDVEGQPVEVPPPEVVEQGVEAIKHYWRQREEVGVDYLCEAKLLIVGEPGAGKTSLARKIDDPAYKLKAREPSTEGIEVIRWKFPAAIRIMQAAGERFVERNFAVNLWDFGGQEIYHATHQFFLTRRSLYLLVADDRKEDTDFNWWLEIVELLSDGSPLLIVQNEKQDRRRDIDLPNLRARFPNLKAAYRINLATNSGLDELTKAIRQELERLPHIGAPLPATWKRVREALEGDERNHIGVDEFFEICETEGFKRDEDKLQLSGYLHDLGICLHFRDDPILKHRVILKPKWATDAVYRVLDDRDVANNRGRFSREDLAHIWEEDTYSAMRDELLRLMMRFQLCYPLPERDGYIAPQLLSSDQPEYAWNAGGNLVDRI